ncbi:hypothetical protein M5689_024880 [Euphorbia peplus]|nr:hypothetical protein M5689_024880 [Euphorbia peplus]
MFAKTDSQGILFASEAKGIRVRVGVFRSKPTRKPCFCFDDFHRLTPKVQDLLRSIGGADEVANPNPDPFVLRSFGIADAKTLLLLRPFGVADSTANSNPNPDPFCFGSLHKQKPEETLRASILCCSRHENSAFASTLLDSDSKSTLFASVLYRNDATANLVLTLTLHASVLALADANNIHLLHFFKESNANQS